MSRVVFAVLPLSLCLACLEPTGQSDDPSDAGVARDAAIVADASVGPDAGCGDPAVRARYPACVGATDQAGCEALDGIWSSGPSGFTFCACPTGEAGCACDHGGQCLGDCMAEIPGSNFDSCQTLMTGTCAEYSPQLGCICTFEAGPPATWLCRD